MTIEHPKYLILAFYSRANVNQGCDADNTAITLPEAQRKARYMLSEEFREARGAARCMRYAKVVLARTGERVYSCFT